MARKDSINSMKEILIKRRDALRKVLADDLGNLTSGKGQTSGDIADAALDSSENEISSQLAEVESRELASIEHALERIRAGEFGVCERCSRAIPMARLNALPYATLCIECQREAEAAGEEVGMNTDWSRLLDETDDSDVSINDIEMDVS
ncbi:MAG: TraR/DksA family transcriptional regulator [Pirellulales bacterium]|nr:TraR/DksA family transcriptional regulator [Pirellulales bacterium]